MRSRGSLWLFHATLVPVLLLGCGDGAGPPADTDPLHFVSIAAGTGFTCGLTANGDAYCWGSADPIFGLSDPTAPEQCRFGPCSTRPRRLTATQPLTGLSANDRYACALAAGGTPYCWGRILVDSDGSYHFGDVPSPLPNGIALSAISAGLPTSAALRWIVRRTAGAISKVAGAETQRSDSTPVLPPSFPTW